MSTEENVKKLLEYCYDNIRGGFNEPPYTASYVAYDRHMTLEEVLEAIEASSQLRRFITPNELGLRRNEPAADSDSDCSRELIKKVTYLISRELTYGNKTPITAEFIAESLHIPLQEASDALKRAIGAISAI